MVKILQGDALTVLRTLPSESVHCIVSSPPYWGLRDYGAAGQLGLESTPQEYVEKMVAVFQEARRVLRADGTLWLNLGDSYATGAGAVGQSPGGGVQGDAWKGHRGSRGGSAKQPHTGSAIGPMTQPNRMPIIGLKPKDLCGIPWRVAFALQADGWYLRQDIIWSKPNPMPESVRDRCTKAHEYIFLLAKSERYYYDAEAIQEPFAPATEPRQLRAQEREARSDGVPGQPAHSLHEPRSYRGSSFTKGKTAEIKPTVGQGARTEADGRNKRSVWTVTTQPFKEAHFATFPPALIEPCILAGCPERTCGQCGIALDSRYGKVRAGTKGKDLAPVRMVRGEGVSGPQESGAELLQQSVRVSVDSQESQHHEGLDHHIEGLQGHSHADASERGELWLRFGAQAGDGEEDRSPAIAGRGSPSSRRKQTQQFAIQPGNAHEAGARQPTETQDRDDSLPPLRREDFDLSVCPSCKATLDEVGVVPGVVLDCFGGAGTTGLVADRMQRNAILIELNPEYAAMAEKRIRGDAPLFAEVA